ncbi:hypothetical protein CC1G_12264 [Coprinopsis cinerea okayama7|uniref:Uncharacterized protein n=1 Tax=Coprinopsis cinerea (strain Okayama-7 / 130 / ATCC MYA-4618 / FGSC 9003) TaxID=240176 RepID=A8NSW3_COPC7|nr:hypothetical protein CC1G_12264 [Coprinopsis cinerea okayama7\|eukprot:XP_001836105.1 hypothetical protein CC1G_12264 [Coprinopsis cinerea okayama7\
MDILGIVGVAAGSVAIPLSAVSTTTAVAGISQGLSAQQQGAGKGGDEDVDKEDPRLAKFNLSVLCSDETSRAKNLVQNKMVVLRQGKLYLDAIDENYRVFPDGHPFSGFYIDYPAGSKPLGLVSTISRDPPELNWIYADREDGSLKYGNKTKSINHIHGPWDWTPDQSAITLEGWEGLVAVEETPGVFFLAYDQNDDHLASLGEKRRVVEVSLQRHLEPPKTKEQN